MIVPVGKNNKKKNHKHNQLNVNSNVFAIEIIRYKCDHGDNFTDQVNDELKKLQKLVTCFTEINRVSNALENPTEL